MLKYYRKSFADDEYAYEQRYLQGKQCKNLWQIVPKKLWDVIDDAITDSDGYWIYIKQGYNMDGDRVIHSYTITGIKEDLKRIERDH